MIPDGEWQSWEADLYSRVGKLGQTTLDAGTRRRAALVVIDDLASMVASADEPQVIALSQAAVRVAPSPEAQIVGAQRSGRGWAALVNAVAAGWNELDEGYRPATCHGGLYALPAAMAEVEAEGGSLDTLLRSVVGGYEVATAYARVMPAPRPLDWHPHATLSPIGAAAAISVARGATGQDTAEAVHVAATLAAAGPFSHATSGVLVRNGWAGHGALAGFTAVEFAGAGVRAHDMSPVEVFHLGFGNPVSFDELTERTSRWAIHDGYHKQYACCQYVHSAVEAALELAAGPLKGRSADEISRIVVETHPLAEPLDDPSPSTVLGAKFSLPHAIAAVLIVGNTEPETFGSKHLETQSVARLRNTVEIARYPGPLTPPHDRPARVSITMQSGETHVAECRSAIGGPDRPLTEDDVLEKVDRLTSTRAPQFTRVATDLLAGRIEGSTAWNEILEQMWSPT